MAKNKKQGSIDMDDTLNRSEATFIKNRKLLTWVVVAIIVIIGGIIAYHNLIAVPNENKASTELGRGQEYFDNEMYDKALNGDGAGYNGFLAIADNYGSTDAGNLANLYAGLCYANLNKWADALEYLKKYDAKGDQMVSPAAIGALGDAYAHNGQLDKAIDNFKKASEMADRHAMDHRNNSLSPTFLIKAGEILESQGKKGRRPEDLSGHQKEICQLCSRPKP
jgi:tetratricopeptide (TPR) repeat protein